MSKYMVVRHEAHTSLSAAISADTTAGQAVKVTGAKTIGPATAITDAVVGVVHHSKTAASGEKVSFRLKGDVIPMKASGAVAAGAKLEAGPAGTVKTQTTGALVGVAWTAAADAAEVLVILV
jgi:hypothetical protein